MKKNNVEVLPKKSVRTFCYLGTPICIILGIMIILDSGALNSNIFLPALGAITILVGILWFPYMQKFKIQFEPDGVKQDGLLSKKISYDNIEKLIVRKGFIEIRSGFFKRISIGDLYTNFEDASEILAAKIQERDNINLSGKQKYIDEYLKPSAALNEAG